MQTAEAMLEPRHVFLPRQRCALLVRSQGLSVPAAERLDVTDVCKEPGPVRMAELQRRTEMGGSVRVVEVASGGLRGCPMDLGSLARLIGCHEVSGEAPAGIASYCGLTEAGLNRAG